MAVPAKKESILAYLEKSDLKALYNQFKCLKVRKGREIFGQDDPPTDLFLIKKGKVRIVRRSAGGQEATLTVLGEGDFFGELAIFTGEPRSAAAVAAANCEILAMRKSDFLKTLSSSPNISLKIMEELSRRLLEADRTISSLLWDNAYQKILLALRRLARIEGVPGPQGVVINRRVTHQEIADMSGMSRETASRVISALKKSGAVVTHRQSLIIRESSMPERIKI